MNSIKIYKKIGLSKFFKKTQLIETVLTKMVKSGSGGLFYLPETGDMSRELPKDFRKPHIEIRAYDKDTLDLLRKPFVEVSGHGPVKPPLIEAEIQIEKEPEIDTTGCRLAFANAARKVIQAHVEADEKRKKGEEVTEPEGVSLKKSHEALQQAVADLRNCLAKGKSTPEALREIVVDEAKEAVKNLLKEQLKSTIGLKLFLTTTETTQSDMKRTMILTRNRMVTGLTQVQKEIESFNKAAVQACDEFEKHRKALDQLFVGATKAYKDIVKDSDGITTLRPGVVKALEAVRQSADEGQLRAAVNELAKQKNDIATQTGKGDDKTKKAGKALIAALEKFEKEYLAA